LKTKKNIDANKKSATQKSAIKGRKHSHQFIEMLVREYR
jgi:hypothetical protein